MPASPFPTTNQAPYGPTLKAYIDNKVVSPFNVLDYGAAGNGVTDDTTAIHAARDAAAAVGADVVFPGGRTYLVGNLTANVVGQSWTGYGATILAKAGLGVATNVLRITAADVTIRGLTFDLSNIANTYPAANLDYPLVSAADGTTWESCYVKSSPGYGIASINGVNRQKVRNCRFLNTAYGAITFYNLTGGPTDAYDFVATGNHIDGSSMGTGSRTSGIGCQASTGQQMHRFVCTGNTVLLPSGQTFGASGIVGAINCTDFTISNNVGVGSNIAYSIAGGDFGVVSSNIARGFSQYGLEVAGTSNHVTMADNTLDGGNLGYRGISASATTTGLSLSGNIIRNLSNGGTGGESAIYLGPASNPSITGNFITNTNNLINQSGITFSQTLASATVAGNAFDGGSAATNCQGIQFLSSVTGCAITGNAFANYPNRAAVRTGAGSGTLDFITMSGNSQKNVATMFQNANFGTAVLGTNNQIPRFDPVVAASASSQSATFATDTYITGTAVTLPTALTSRTMYRVRFNVSKTAAGVAAPVLTLRVGTAGSTADTAISTITFSAQTAVADTGVIEVFANFRAAGASATLGVAASMIHSQGTTGLNVLNSETKFANTSNFNSTTVGQILGLSLNAGASAAWTVDVVQTELFNLPQAG